MTLVLATWKIKRVQVGDRPMLEVTCPHRTCKRSFIVPLAWRTHIRNSKFIGRPCPWCFKTSQLPAGRTTTKGRN